MNRIYEERSDDIILVSNGKKITLRNEMIEDLNSVMSLDSHSELYNLLKEEGEGFVECFERVTGIDLRKGIGKIRMKKLHNRNGANNAT